MEERKRILDEAIKCVCNDRDRQYGSPENSFFNIAQLQNSYLQLRMHQCKRMNVDFVFDAHDVAIMMTLFKIGRTFGGYKDDNYIDGSGYLACAGEIMNAVCNDNNSTGATDKEK